MSVVVNKITLDPIQTENPGKFLEGYFWINPDLSAVEGWHHRYWIETGGAFTLMGQAARDAVDVAETIALDLSTKERLKEEWNADPIFQAFVLLLIDELNILRAEHGLPARTLAQLVSAMENKIDNP